MHRYRVADTSPINRLFSLRDSSGQFHLCRAVAELPEIGQAVMGSGPRLGFHLIVAHRTGKAYRAIFEQLNCNGAALLEILHPASKLALVASPARRSQSANAPRLRDLGAEET